MNQRIVESIHECLTFVDGFISVSVSSLLPVQRRRSSMLFCDHINKSNVQLRRETACFIVVVIVMQTCAVPSVLWLKRNLLCFKSYRLTKSQERKKIQNYRPNWIVTLVRHFDMKRPRGLHNESFLILATALSRIVESETHTRVHTHMCTQSYALYGPYIPCQRWNWTVNVGTQFKQLLCYCFECHVLLSSRY